MRISDWSSDVCASDLHPKGRMYSLRVAAGAGAGAAGVAAGAPARLIEVSCMACAVTGVDPGGEFERETRILTRGCKHSLGADAFDVYDVSRALVARSGRERSEEHTSELQSLMRISYAVFR